KGFTDRSTASKKPTVRYHMPDVIPTSAIVPESLAKEIRSVDRGISAKAMKNLGISQEEAGRCYASGNLFNYRWMPATVEIQKVLSERLSLIDEKYRFDADNTVVSITRLPWYQNVFLIRLKDPSWNAQKLALYYMIDDNLKLLRLNGTSPPIHELNSKSPIRLDEHNVLDYLRFFGFFVRGEQGPFYIIEDLKDPVIPKDEQVIKILRNTIRPASFEGMSPKGNFYCDGIVYYANVVFISNFEVQPTGMVEMLNDEAIGNQLPGSIDEPIS
ncbi:MAG: hypothetical protein AAFO69_18960, partial [Bacteroidota bacterium]